MAKKSYEKILNKILVTLAAHSHLFSFIFAAFSLIHLMSIFINTHLNKFSTSSERMSRSITIGCSQGLAFSNLRKYGLHALNTT